MVLQVPRLVSGGAGNTVPQRPSVCTVPVLPTVIIPISQTERHFLHVLSCVQFIRSSVGSDFARLQAVLLLSRVRFSAATVGLPCSTAPATVGSPCSTAPASCPCRLLSLCPLAQQQHWA